MEKRAVFTILIGLLMAVLNVFSAVDKTEYFKEGGDLTLRPVFPDPIVNILWKLEGDLVAEWIKDKVPLEYYGRFDGRTTLDTKTGTLVMKNLSKKDEGLFTLELNSKVQPQRYISKAIKELLAKPYIWMSPVACNPDSHSECMLSCEGNATDAGPVTYSWRMGDGTWGKKTTENTISISKADSAVKTYTCRMENPVSVQESEPKNNPFFEDEPPPPGPGMIIGIVVGVIALAVLGGVGWKFRDNIKEFLPSKRDRVSNGNTAKNEDNTGAGTPLTEKETNTGAAVNA